MEEIPILIFHDLRIRSTRSSIFIPSALDIAQVGFPLDGDMMRGTFDPMDSGDRSIKHLNWREQIGCQCLAFLIEKPQGVTMDKVNGCVLSNNSKSKTLDLWSIQIRKWFIYLT